MKADGLLKKRARERVSHFVKGFNYIVRDIFLDRSTSISLRRCGNGKGGAEESCSPTSFTFSLLRYSYFFLCVFFLLPCLSHPAYSVLIIPPSPGRTFTLFQLFLFLVHIFFSGNDLNFFVSSGVADEKEKIALYSESTLMQASHRLGRTRQSPYSLDIFSFAQDYWRHASILIWPADLFLRAWKKKLLLSRTSLLIMSCITLLFVFDIYIQQSHFLLSFS